MARYLAFVQRLALLTPIAGCGSPPPPAPTPMVAAPPPTPAGTTATTEPSSEPVAISEGKCRCSWDTVAAAAPRVCKKGEVNYQGQVCAPASHPKWNGPVKGPLPPPDLPHARSIA